MKSGSGWVHKLAAGIMGLILSSAYALPQTGAPSASMEDTTRQLWQLLEYIAVDYHGAVADGEVRNTSEFSEMKEFAKSVHERLQSLPPAPDKSHLQALGAQLELAIDQRAEATVVAEQSRALASSLIKSYPLTLAPASAPNLARGATLYQAQCAACHGTTGHADGVLAAQLRPAPVAFSDNDRSAGRSLAALYQVINQGVAGTAMPNFAKLSESDRWALAYFVGTLSYTDAMREQGEHAWRTLPQLRAAVPDLAALSRLTEYSVSGVNTPAQAREAIAYLRSNPEVLSQAQPTGLKLVRLKLAQSLDAFKADDKARATRLALSAYLDGFEPLEPTLSARDKDLLKQIETGMLAYRAVIAQGTIPGAQAALSDLTVLLDRAESTLGGTAEDPTTTFVGALTILLREGVEALLVVVGMIAFLKKAGRNAELKHVHAGWVGALAGGALTWVIATYFVGISGASRELTEGLSSIFAALVLLAVGLWMHQKSAAGRWQTYLHAKLSAATSRGSAFALFALAFVAVYREVFETVLFYSALWAEGNRSALLAGLGAGVASLALVAWALLRSSANMPISRFFSLSSVLVAVLAVVLAGKGIKALQEAGLLTANLLSMPRIDVLGVYPSAESLTAQLAVLAIALLGFAFNARSAKQIKIRGN